MERELTIDESNILNVIQDMYGDQNTTEQIFFSDSEACISIKNSVGENIMFANISNLATWHSDCSIATEKELREKWLSM